MTGDISDLMVPGSAIFGGGSMTSRAPNDSPLRLNHHAPQVGIVKITIPALLLIYCTFGVCHLF